MKIKIVTLFFLLAVFSSLAQEVRGVVTTNVNVRWEPTTKSGIIKVFEKGKEVIILKTKGGWSFVQDPNNNKKGWISSNFIQSNISYITQNANVRNTAGGRILKQINKGQKVIVLQEQGNWSFIKDVSNNKKGWVHQSLLSSYSIQSNSKRSNSSTSSSSTVSSSSASSSSNSSIGIIEQRMRSKGLYSQWVQFYRDMPDRFVLNDVNTFVNTAKSCLGVPYKSRGTTKNGLDCSGLVYYSLKSVGYDNRLNAEGFAKIGRFIANKSSLRVGDLVFFKTGSKLISHVGIYVGNDEFIHAPSSGKSVGYVSIYDPYYWSDRFLFGVRLTRD